MRKKTSSSQTRLYPGDGPHFWTEIDVDGTTGKVLKFERRMIAKGVVVKKNRAKKKK
jgi:hypothetical protein